MKVIKTIVLILTVTLFGSSCSGNTEEKQSQQQDNTGEVEVYYFHNTRRCATCKAVERETEKALKELYGDKVRFLTYNLEEAEGEKKAEEIGISGQTLIIVSGETRINITTEAFMNARYKPSELKKIIKESIDPLLK
jgi:hypothetical protein